MARKRTCDVKIATLFKGNVTTVKDIAVRETEKTPLHAPIPHEAVVKKNVSIERCCSKFSRRYMRYGNIPAVMVKIM